MVTDSFPPLATEMTPGRTDSNHGKTPNFFTTASAPSMSVVCPPETCEPWTCPRLLPSPIFVLFPVTQDAPRPHTLGREARVGVHEPRESAPRRAEVATGPGRRAWSVSRRRGVAPTPASASALEGLAGTSQGLAAA